jgi:hypothetical protein
MRAYKSLVLFAAGIASVTACKPRQSDSDVLAVEGGQEQILLPAITKVNAFRDLSFIQPTALVQRPGDDSKFFILEKPGRILVFDNRPTRPRSARMPSRRSTSSSAARTSAGAHSKGPSAARTSMPAPAVTIPLLRSPNTDATLAARSQAASSTGERTRKRRA